MIEILTTSVPSTVQDCGRRGHLSAGIGRAGAMDGLAFSAGNALLGNAEDAAGLEIALFPFRLRFETDTRFALSGADCGATLDGRPVPPFWTRHASAGQVLALGAPLRGARAYVAVAGGVAVPAVMGSRSTDLKGGFGGLEGRGFRRGDRLVLGEATGARHSTAAFGAALPSPAAAPDRSIALRVIPAAEHEVFDEASLQSLTQSDWHVGSEANRMGYRLDGPTLRLQRPLELFSHGILPGIVQVPSNGQPIIQLADANTCGGYPKIAAVIDADLWRVAQAPVGATLRFVIVDPEAATRALAAQGAWLAELRASAGRLLRRG